AAPRELEPLLTHELDWTPIVPTPPWCPKGYSTPAKPDGSGEPVTSDRFAPSLPCVSFVSFVEPQQISPCCGSTKDTKDTQGSDGANLSEVTGSPLPSGFAGVEYPLGHQGGVGTIGVQSSS